MKNHPGKDTGAKNNSASKWLVPDNVTRPASSSDYAAIDGCVKALRSGLFHSATQAQFLYCSILPPHPVTPESCKECGTTYPTNATYMHAVKDLNVTAPQQVPWAELHPNDFAQIRMKSSTWYDDVPVSQIEHFRRVYFSMCYESDSLLGFVLDELKETSLTEQEFDSTFVIFISDHGENAIEHRQTGKNNMYDSAGRVAMIMAGPGIVPGTVITGDQAIASLNDVYPTIISFAGLNVNVNVNLNVAPTKNLAGRSLLPLASGKTDPDRKDHVVAQYHSVDSITGSFMIRQHDMKLIVFGTNAFESHALQYQPQLFNMTSDPWELHDLAKSAAHAGEVSRLTTLLATELNVSEIDTRCKRKQAELFKTQFYDPAVAKDPAYGCSTLMQSLLKATNPPFNETDTAKVALWLDAPCAWPKPSPADPKCQRGVENNVQTVCCAGSCGVCAHPGSACAKRPGGRDACCPSYIAKANRSCDTHSAPCVLDAVRKY